MAARRDARPLDVRCTAIEADVGLEPCRCRAAVKRAYASMITSGASARVALDAAQRVYLYHHPSFAEDEARHIVENWVFTGPLH